MLWPICKFCFAFLILFMLSLVSIQAQQVQVTASVSPVHIIVLDENSQIIKILSNTESHNPSILARRHSEFGSEVLITPTILFDYQKLKSKYAFSSPGLVYQKPKTISQQFIYWLKIHFSSEPSS